MANAFWNFVNRFVPGTKVKAAEANAQFDGVTTGFDVTEAAMAVLTTASANATAAAAAATAAATSALNTGNTSLVLAQAALPRTGGAMTGPLSLPFDATSALHAVPKQQLDSEVASKANSANPIFTGNVEVPTPTLTTDAASKSYVDSQNIAQDVALSSALSLKANLSSPSFTDVPTMPTAALGTNTTQAATTAFVQAAVVASTAGVASFNGRTGSVTLLTADISSTLGYTPFNPAGSLPSLLVSGSAPWVNYRDTDTAVNASGLWRAGAVDGNFRVRRNTAPAGDFSTFDSVLDANASTIAWMGNAIWHTANLTNLNQLTNGPGYITSASAPVQSVFGRTGVITMSLTDITTALGYAPVQQGSGIGQSADTVKIGWSAGSKLKATINASDIGNIALESWVTSQNYLTGITSGQITSALGFTPYSNANPSGYMNNAAVNASYMPRTGGIFTGDIFVTRSASPSTGVMFLGNTGSRYVFYDGTNYNMPGSALVLGGRLFANGLAGNGIGSIYVQSGGTFASGLSPGDFGLVY